MLSHAIQTLLKYEPIESPLRKSRHGFITIPLLLISTPPQIYQLSFYIFIIALRFNFLCFENKT